MFMYIWDLQGYVAYGICKLVHFPILVLYRVRNSIGIYTSIAGYLPVRWCSIV